MGHRVQGFVDSGTLGFYLPMKTRQYLRTELRQQRRAISSADQALAAIKLLNRLCRHPWIRKAHFIGVYMASDGEMSLAPLLRWAHSVHKHLYLPCLAANKTLVFKPLAKGSRLHTNQFGIPEPLTCQQLALSRLDVLLMPLVGFDRYGNRLGMGGGYYDRSLSKRSTRTPKLVGIAHHCQEVAKLEPKKWDIPVDAIATDKEFIAISAKP